MSELTIIPFGRNPLSDFLPEPCRALFEQAFDLVAVLELPEMRVRAINTAGRALLQMGMHEAVEDEAAPPIVAPSTHRLMCTQGLHALLERRPWRLVGRLQGRTGREIPVRIGLAALTAPGARPALALLTALDETPVQNLQRVLRNEQLLLHATLSTLPDSIHFKDCEGRYIRASSSLAERLGLSVPEDLIGHRDADFFAAEAVARSEKSEQRIIETTEPELDCEEEKTWPDGHKTWVSTSCFPLRDWRGEIVGTFGISRDITRRKQAEAERRRIEGQLFQAHKMESIGRLAAGVAHEINTPMQYVSDNAHFLDGAVRQIGCVFAAYRALLEQARRQPDLVAAVAAVEAAELDAEINYLLNELPTTLMQTNDGIARVSRIVQSLREFAHPAAPEKQPADLNRALETAVAVSRHEWKLVAEVVTDLDRDLPLVPCVLDEMNQVILNLIVNAAHAIADVVKERPGERGCITLRSRRDGAWAVFEVQDTGSGIPEPVQKHIFEPFFTTKPVGRGTGQGLALVHTIVVNHHQGEVGFTTENSRGTIFWVRLPVLVDPVEATLPAEPPQSPAP